MVVVSSSITIVPKNPTPKCFLNLSEFDQIQPLTYTPFVYLYKPPYGNTNNETLLATYEAIKKSLSSILVHYYPLAGRYYRIKDSDRFMIECNAKGAWLLEATTDSKMEDYGDFAPTETVIKDLVPQLDYNNPVDEWPLLLVQLTKFRCGGLCVAVAYSHLVLDGWGAFQFVNSWAKLARAECLSEAEIPVHNRIGFLSSVPLMAPHFDHVEYRAPPSLLHCYETESKKEKETSVTIMRVTKEQVEMLKKGANEIFNGNNMERGCRPYSTYEVLAGHMWRSACRARKGAKQQPTVIHIVSNIRNRMKPQIPLRYSGNGISRMLTPISLSGDIMNKHLSYASQKIRDATNMFTDEYIKSSLNFLAAQEHVDWMRLRSRESYFYGNPNLNIGSFLNIPIYNANFGGGKPLFVGIGFSLDDGGAYIIPSFEGDGSVDITLALETKHMEDFKKFFYESIALDHSEDQLDNQFMARL